MTIALPSPAYRHTPQAQLSRCLKWYRHAMGWSWRIEMQWVGARASSCRTVLSLWSRGRSPPAPQTCLVLVACVQMHADSRLRWRELSNAHSLAPPSMRCSAFGPCPTAAPRLANEARWRTWYLHHQDISLRTRASTSEMCQLTWERFTSQASSLSTHAFLLWEGQLIS